MYLRAFICITRAFFACTRGDFISILERISCPIEKVSTAHSIYAQLYHLKSPKSSISIKCNPEIFALGLCAVESIPILQNRRKHILQPTKVIKFKIKLGQRDPRNDRKAHLVLRKSKTYQIKDMV